MLEIAIEDNHAVEIDLTLDIINNTVPGQEVPI